MAKKKQIRKARKRRLEAKHTRKYRELKDKDRARNDDRALLEGRVKAAQDYVEERQVTLKGLRTETETLANALKALSSQAGALSRKSDAALKSFRAEPVENSSVAILIEERDNAFAKIAELEKALSEARERLSERVLQDHVTGGPPNWLRRLEQELAPSGVAPDWEFYNKVGQRAIRWAKDCRILGKESAEAEPESDES